MPEEPQHGTESKHHFARTDRCSTSALSSASSTVNKREHASGAAAWNGVQASSFQNKSAARMRSQVHHQERSTENMPEEQQHGTESKHHLSRTDKCSTNALSSASSTENNREHASGAAARNRVQASSCQNGQVQHKCAVKCIINSEQERTCQRSSSTERSPSIIFPQQEKCSTNALSSASSTENNREHASGATARNGVQASCCQNGASRVRCQVHHQQ